MGDELLQPPSVEVTRLFHVVKSNVEKLQLNIHMSLSAAGFSMSVTKLVCFANGITCTLNFLLQNPQNMGVYPYAELNRHRFPAPPVLLPSYDTSIYFNVYFTSLQCSMLTFFGSGLDENSTLKVRSGQGNTLTFLQRQGKKSAAKKVLGLG